MRSSGKRYPQKAEVERSVCRRPHAAHWDICRPARSRPALTNCSPAHRWHRMLLSLSALIRPPHTLSQQAPTIPVFLTINGERCSLWRAVDQEGIVLDILVQSRRDARAATTFFRKRLNGLCDVPRVLITDKRASDGVAHRDMLPNVAPRRSTYLNNRAENAHQPTRQKERALKRFTSPGHAQRVLSAFSGISPHVRPRRHRLTARH